MKHECPYCLSKVNIATRMKYFFHGTDYYVECPHCGNEIRPSKEPVPFYICFSSGGLSVLASFWAYIYLIEDHFFHAILFAICFGVIDVSIITILMLKRIKFTK